MTRAMGDAWLDRASAGLLRVPSVVIPVADGDDRNVLVNHRHEDASRLTVSGIEPLAYDPRLLAFG
jgi:RES domain-containing protein